MFAPLLALRPGCCSVYQRLKIGLVVFALACMIRTGADTLDQLGPLLAFVGLVLLSLLGVCVATKISNSLVTDEDSSLTLDVEQQRALPRVTVTEEDDELDEWETEQDRISQFEAQRVEELERELQRATVTLNLVVREIQALLVMVDRR